MNKRTLDFMTVFHDGALFGVDAIPRAVFNAARTTEESTYVQILGCWTHIDNTLEDGEVEFYKGKERVHFCRLTLDFDKKVV